MMCRAVARASVGLTFISDEAVLRHDEQRRSLPQSFLTLSVQWCVWYSDERGFLAMASQRVHEIEWQVSIPR